MTWSVIRLGMTSCYFECAF